MRGIIKVTYKTCPCSCSRSSQLIFSTNLAIECLKTALPTVAKATPSANFDKFAPGEMVIYKCDSGYIVSGSTTEFTLTCMQTNAVASWSSPSTCIGNLLSSNTRPRPCCQIIFR